MNSTPDVPSETKPSPGATAPMPPGLAHRVVDAPARCDLWKEPSAGLAALHQPRHVRAGEPAPVEHGLGPIPPFDIEPERSGRVGHVRHLVAGEPQAQVVLG